MKYILNMLLNSEFNGVYIDSREVKKDGLFIPIEGEKFNGNSFIEEAFNKGAKLSLVTKSYYKENYERLKNYNLIEVEDTLKFMQQLSKKYRELTNVFVVGVTGSNGKTSTKNIIYNVLKTSFKTYATKGNYNNDIGLPLTILNMKHDTEYLVLEMGMSALGEIDLLADISKPNIAVITNIGSSHIEFLKTKENIFKAKKEIFNYFDKTNYLILNGEDRYLRSLEDKFFNIIKTDKNKLENLSVDEDAFFSFTYSGIDVKLNVRGLHHVYNSMIAIETAKLLNIKDENIAKGISFYSGEKRRFDIYNIRGFKLIDDSYNASYDSIKMAVNSLVNMKSKRKFAVLGDVLELGELSEKEHILIGEIEELKKLDAVYTIGEYSKFISLYLRNSIHFKDIMQLVKFLNMTLKEGDTILIKASRAMQLERVIKYLGEFNE